MPTKRVPIVRHHRRPVSAEWAEKSRRLCELSAHRQDCKKDYGVICKRCREYLRLHMEVILFFRIPPWRALDDQIEAPRGLSEQQLSDFWSRALRDAVDEALDEPSPIAPILD